MPFFGPPPQFVGATSSLGGVLGLVPTPLAGEQNNLLAGDGTFFPNWFGGNIPSDRYIGPFQATGSAEYTVSLYNYYTSMAVYYLPNSRSITESKIQVITGMTNTNSPQIQYGAYNLIVSSNVIRIGARIANSYVTGIDATTTGVKTTTHSPSWTAPRGLFCILLKSKSSTLNNSGTLRSFANNGRETYLAAQFLGGFNDSSPTTQFSMPQFPFPEYFGNNVDLKSDYSTTNIYYEPTFSAFTQPAVMIK